MRSRAAITILLVSGACKSDEARKAPPPAVDKAPGPGGVARPPWITSDQAGTASCADAGGRLSCVGVSFHARTQDGARADAGYAAAEELIDTIGRDVEQAYPAWKTRAGYLALRDAAMAAGVKGAPRLRAVRQRVAEGFSQTRKAAGAFTPGDSWWEQYERGPGLTEFLAFARYQLGEEQRKALVAEYGEAVDAAGSKLMTVFPGSAWESPGAPTAGARVVEPGGALAAKKVAAGSVITAVDGKPVGTAADAARLLGESTKPVVSVLDPSGVRSDLPL